MIKTKRVSLGWGENRLTLDLTHPVDVIQPDRQVPLRPSNLDLVAHLMSPIGERPLPELLASINTVVIILPDESRFDMRPYVKPVLETFFRGHVVSYAIAAGKHPFRSPTGGEWRHDAHSPDLVRAGVTDFGTEVYYPEVVLDAELRILVGEIRPHYFAGYSGGAKTLFPGMAGADGIWHNHTLKSHYKASLGRVDDNPCRRDMEEAAAFAGRSFLINAVRNDRGVVTNFFTGHPILAHRLGVAYARGIYEVQVERRYATVVVSDTHPVSMNLYQACKMIAVAAPLLLDGGTIILCAACEEGLGPVDVINSAIYELGLKPILPEEHQIYLVSKHPASAIQPYFIEYLDSPHTILGDINMDDVVIVPYATSVIPVLASPEI
ncbi:MAG: lactate racemase domain-containing protein [Bradymonadia bacterium]